MKNDRFNRFSVSLGLLDYVNPVFYTITIITIIKNIGPLLGNPYSQIMITGAVLSILFGFIIPTGKVIVGLGILQFRMPVSLVFCVNTGILMSGLMLLKYVLHLKVFPVMVIFTAIAALLFLICRKSRKMNTVAVMVGAFGYILIYISLIILSLKKHYPLPALLYAAAIFLFVMLCGIGIRADLKDPKVHWKIEISNVICQGLVALGTIILFR